MINWNRSYKTGHRNLTGNPAIFFTLFSEEQSIKHKKAEITRLQNTSQVNNAVDDCESDLRKYKNKNKVTGTMYKCKFFKFLDVC